MLNAGRYQAKAIDAKIDKTDNEKYRVLVQLEVTDGPSKGQTVVYRGYLTEAAKEYTVASLKTLGWDGKDIRQLKQGLAAGLGGCEVNVVIEHETYTAKDGTQKTDARVRWVNPIGGGGIQSPSKVTDSELDALAVSLGQSAVPTTPRTDNIPF